MQPWSSAQDSGASQWHLPPKNATTQGCLRSRLSVPLLTFKSDARQRTDTLLVEAADAATGFLAFAAANAAGLAMAQQLTSNLQV